MDHTQILQHVENVWQAHCATLEQALDETFRELMNLIRLDEYHRHGHDEQNLKDTLGPFASANLDLSSLSKVLGTSGASRSFTKERLARINLLAERIGELKEFCANQIAPFPTTEIGEDERAIHEKAEAHLNQMAEIFKSLRVAQLEIRSKYHPATHDPVFDNFNWRLLSPGELSLCPPFLILADLDGDSGSQLRKIMSLLESRKPLKIAAIRTSMRKVYSPTADPSVPASMAVETLPLAMRGVYFIQSCIAAPDFRKRIAEALASPRPTLLSLIGQKPNEESEAFKLRAERAMRSRAFPSVIYDPDRARGFVSCFDLSGNPELDADFTFAHFAAGEKEFETEFSDPTADFSPEDLVPVSDFLALARHQRVGKYPCVYLQRRSGQALPKIVSPAIVTQTSDQIHLWKTLQEITGVDNPYVKTTEATLTAEFGAKQKELMDKLQEDMEKKLSHREQMAVAEAVQKMVAFLTGVHPSEINLEGLIDPSASPKNN